MDTLVLNADAQPVSFLPLSAINWQDAIVYMYNDKCDVLEWYDDWTVRSERWETRVPAVIMLREFMKKQRTVRYSKPMVYLRDQYKCVYCGCSLTRGSATLDHYIPKSRGGKATWENSVTACASCNGKKGNNVDGWKLPYKPHKPGYYELVRKRKQLPFTVKHPSWYTWMGIEVEG